MSHFAVCMNDGSVAIMEILPRPMLRKRDGKTVMIMSKPEAEIARWAEQDRRKVVSVKAIGTADIPTDRAFRDAWKFDGKRIGYDTPKV